MTKTIFWNVDTQYDFMNPNGKLYVQGAEEIEVNLEYLTNLAHSRGIQIINSADYHTSGSREISDSPDFITTFPEHCMKGTPGAEYITATTPLNPYVVSWEDKTLDKVALANHRDDIVIRKDEFDVFHPSGAPYTKDILDIVEPTRVFGYGVASNVCDDFAFMGILERGVELYVVQDGIKELPGLPIDPILQKWKDAGAKFINTQDVEAVLGMRNLWSVTFGYEICDTHGGDVEAMKDYNVFANSEEEALKKTKFLYDTEKKILGYQGRGTYFEQIQKWEIADLSDLFGSGDADIDIKIRGDFVDLEYKRP